MEMVELVVWAVRKLRKSHPYIPRHWSEQLENKSLANVMNMEEEFTFHPYVYTLQWTSSLSLSDLHN